MTTEIVLKDSIIVIQGKLTSEEQEFITGISSSDIEGINYKVEDYLMSRDHIIKYYECPLHKDKIRFYADCNNCMKEYKNSLF